MLIEIATDGPGFLVEARPAKASRCAVGSSRNARRSSAS